MLIMLLMGNSFIPSDRMLHVDVVTVRILMLQLGKGLWSLFICWLMIQTLNLWQKSLLIIWKWLIMISKETLLLKFAQLLKSKWKCSLYVFVHRIEFPSLSFSVVLEFPMHETQNDNWELLVFRITSLCSLLEH